METLNIGCASGFSGDRIDAGAAVLATLIHRGGPAALIFETLAERTLGLARLARRQDANAGYEPLLAELVSPVLAASLAHGIKIVGNFGAANPRGAALVIRRIAREQGLRTPRVAVVSGDDVSEPAYRDTLLRALGEVDGQGGEPGEIVGANAYLGAESIARALREGADIVVTGRVADPSLTVGPCMAHYGWATDDWNRLARATMAGHLLECGAQVTGGYFADPGFKDVDGLATLGFPVASVDADGGCVVTKADRTGGCVTERTVKEQLLYELHDPSGYLTPDVVADISAAEVREVRSDAVRLSGVTGRARPDSLKVSVFHEQGWLAEGEISYAGRGAEARARLAADVLRTRLTGCGPLRIDLIGVASVLGDDAGAWLADRLPTDVTDVRLRIALSHADKSVATRLVREVNALYTCGPAGGGGVRTGIQARLGMRSCLLARDLVHETVEFIE